MRWTFFAKLENSFQLFEKSPQFFCAIHNYKQDTFLSLIYAINIFSITVLSLETQQNKWIPNLQHLPIPAV